MRHSKQLYFPSVKTTTCSLSRHIYFPDSFKFVLLYKSLPSTCRAHMLVLGRIPTKGNDYCYIIYIVVLKPYGPTSIFILRSDCDSKWYHDSVQRITFLKYSIRRVRQSDGWTDMALSIRLLMLFQNINCFWGLPGIHLPVTFIFGWLTVIAPFYNILCV